jgi:hypothetical protein
MDTRWLLLEWRNHTYDATNINCLPVNISIYSEYEGIYKCICPSMPFTLAGPLHQLN